MLTYQILLRQIGVKNKLKRHGVNQSKTCGKMSAYMLYYLQHPNQ